MILQTTTLGRFIKEENAVSFVSNLNKELPVVSIITPVPDVPSLVGDSEEDFKNLLRHLIDDHGEKTNWIRQHCAFNFLLSKSCYCRSGYF